jgi:hypothetical protein
MPVEPDPHDPIEESDRWLLPVGDGIVTQLQIDFAFGFTVEQRLHFRIAERFSVEDGSGTARYDPERRGSVGPLADLHGAVVTEATVYRDGRLVVCFADGRALSVPPGEHYEAFEVTGSRDASEPFRLISLPGGGLAEWVQGGAA